MARQPGGTVSLLFWASAALTTWVYAGYPLTLSALTAVRPRPRSRGRVRLPVSIVIAAHNEEPAIAAKVDNVLASIYPRELIEVVVASDGSTDRTVEEARRAGADLVLDLPRIGKIAALNAAVEQAHGEILAFTDADCSFELETLTELTANFADPRVGGVSANEVTVAPEGIASVARGEGLYWRYEQLIKRLEDRVGSTVSASGRLYAVRRSLFRPSALTSGTDDFVISTQVVRAGARLAFDERTRVVVERLEDDSAELDRKVRVMNRGLRAAFSLGADLLPHRTGGYGVQVLSHKILRRFVPFFLIVMLGSSAALAGRRRRWLGVLLPQLSVYALAAAGWVGRNRSWGRAKPLWVPYFFCLGNLAAGLAVVSLLRGKRFERWDPVRESPLAGEGAGKETAGFAERVRALDRGAVEGPEPA